MDETKEAPVKTKEEIAEKRLEQSPLKKFQESQIKR